MDFLSKLLIFAPPLLVAVVLHEVAHGYAALKLGDPTARNLGRLSLNPIKHIDLFMTILLPGMLILSNSPIIFGGAKPVPVDPRYFKEPRKGMAIVAVAGPITNFILATLCYLLYRAILGSEIMTADSIVLGLIIQWLLLGVVTNMVLGIFNLFPVPPLDGGRILVGLLPLEPARQLARLERFGLLILVFFLLTGTIDKVLQPPLRAVIEHMTEIGIENEKGEATR